MTNVDWLCKMLTLGEAGYEVYENSLTYLCNSSLSLKLFIYLFIYLFWLCWVFVAACGLSLVAVSSLLIAVASLVAEHRL